MAFFIFHLFQVVSVMMCHVIYCQCHVVAAQISHSADPGLQWSESRSYFYWRLKRRLLEDRMVKDLQVSCRDDWLENVERCVAPADWDEKRMEKMYLVSLIERSGLHVQDVFSSQGYQKSFQILALYFFTLDYHHFPDKPIINDTVLLWNPQFLWFKAHCFMAGRR